MSIIIKGMKKPKSCLDYKNEYRCPLLSDIEDVCLAQGEDSYNCKSWEELYASCPIVAELPPHGRLIEADALCERFMTAWDVADKEKKTLISAVFADIVTPIVVGMPTIIEAEGAE